MLNLFHSAVAVADVAWWQVAIYFIIGFGCWFVMNGLELWGNGYPMHEKHAVFKGFYEKLLWYIPGGLQRRTERVRLMVNDRIPYISLGGYPPEVIRNENRYEEVAKSIFSSGLLFWGEQIIAFFLWPLVIVLIVGSNVFGIIMNTWSKLTTRRDY